MKKEINYDNVVAEISAIIADRLESSGESPDKYRLYELRVMLKHSQNFTHKSEVLDINLI